jgi:hypothetical protein
LIGTPGDIVNVIIALGPTPEPVQVSVNVPVKPILDGTDAVVNVKTVGCMVGVHREGGACVGDCTTPPFCEIVFDEWMFFSLEAVRRIVYSS